MRGKPLTVLCMSLSVISFEFGEHGPMELNLCGGDNALAHHLADETMLEAKQWIRKYLDINQEVRFSEHLKSCFEALLGKCRNPPQGGHRNLIAEDRRDLGHAL